MQNFAVITREFLRQKAIVQVSDEFELSAAVRDLLESRRDAAIPGRTHARHLPGQARREEHHAHGGVIVQSLEAESGA